MNLGLLLVSRIGLKHWKYQRITTASTGIPAHASKRHSHQMTMFRFVLGFELSWTSLFTVLMRPTAELQQIKGLTGPPPGKGSSKAGHYRTMIQVALALSNQRERGPMIWKHYENTCCGNISKLHKRVWDVWVRVVIHGHSQVPSTAFPGVFLSSGPKVRRNPWRAGAGDGISVDHAPHGRCKLAAKGAGCKAFLLMFFLPMRHERHEQ